MDSTTENLILLTLQFFNYLFILRDYSRTVLSGVVEKEYPSGSCNVNRVSSVVSFRLVLHVIPTEFCVSCYCSFKYLLILLDPTRGRERVGMEEMNWMSDYEQSQG